MAGRTDIGSPHAAGAKKRAPASGTGALLAASTAARPGVQRIGCYMLRRTFSPRRAFDMLSPCCRTFMSSS
jgi:hypothetical protein